YRGQDNVAAAGAAASKRRLNRPDYRETRALGHREPFSARAVPAGSESRRSRAGSLPNLPRAFGSAAPASAPQARRAALEARPRLGSSPGKSDFRAPIVT